MEILTEQQIRSRTREFIDKIRQGAVFIYPTDTIYGIGCIATDSLAIKKIRRLKERPDTPFSVWIPSQKWIENNCEVNKKAQEWIKQLPGPYTLILKLKNNKDISPKVNPCKDTIGIRMPNHWFQEIVEKIDQPIITTSVNRSREPPMTSLENLDQEIKSKVDFIIYDGKKEARASKIINLVENRIIER